ncbi:hypothetical protein D3C85_1411110 [compost metagenome]
MVRLAGEIRRHVVIHAIFLKRVVTQIGPQHRHHAQFVRTLKRCRDLFNLTTRLFRAKVNGRPHRHRAHVEGLFNAGIQRLIVFGWVAQGFVVVQFYKEWNAVRVTARHRSQHAVS